MGSCRTRALAGTACGTFNECGECLPHAAPLAGLKGRRCGLRWGPTHGCANEPSSEKAAWPPFLNSCHWFCGWTRSFWNILRQEGGGEATRI